MVQFKSIILITVVGLAILLSGCVGKPTGTPTPTTTVAPTVTPTATYTVTATPAITATPIVKVTTPTPISKAPMLSGAVYVDSRMRISNSINGTYVLSTVQATITDVTNTPISLKAQIVSAGQILEEQSFTLQSGSSYNYVTKAKYPTNSSNVSLWLFAEGYQPTEYKVTKHIG